MTLLNSSNRQNMIRKAVSGQNFMTQDSQFLTFRSKWKDDDGSDDNKGLSSKRQKTGTHIEENNSADMIMHQVQDIQI